MATLRAEYSFDDQTIIGCPTQEQLAAILASVMVVHISNRGRLVSSNSRELSESPELISRKMSTKSVKFQDIADELSSNGVDEHIEVVDNPLPLNRSNDSKTVDNVSPVNGNVNEEGEPQSNALSSVENESEIINI